LDRAGDRSGERRESPTPESVVVDGSAGFKWALAALRVG